MRAREPLLVLASASPRRQKLMKCLGYDFVAEAPSDPKLEREGPRAGEVPEDYVLRLAGLKARGVAGRLPGRVVIGADTVVVLGSEILGKPKDRGEALEMLRKLSGGDHVVVTGVVLLDGRNGREKSFSVRTRVRFYSPGEDALSRYAASEEPLDKAGAYAIQGEGGFLVRAVSGSYTNVVGLPLEELSAALRELLGE